MKSEGREEMARTPLLVVQNLRMSYGVRGGVLTAVNNVDFMINRPGQSLAIVGESGCGKTSLSLALMRLLPGNVVEYSGDVLFQGKNIMNLSREEFRGGVRWKQISWVPQNVAAMLTPMYTVGASIEEILRVHEFKERRGETVRLLELVGLKPEHAKSYPHQLSGGMLQRALIARALALQPSLVILDEPTSALDASLKGQIISLLKELQQKLSISYIFITHDIVMASKLCELFAVIYAGRIVERGTAEAVLKNPLHRYTQKLLACIMTSDTDKIESIPGEPPDLRLVSNGCPFWPREALRCDGCRPDEAPVLVEAEPGHFVARHARK